MRSVRKSSESEQNSESFQTSHPLSGLLRKRAGIRKSSEKMLGFREFSRGGQKSESSQKETKNLRPFRKSEATPMSAHKPEKEFTFP
jgi:hypothetical protein